MRAKLITDTQFEHVCNVVFQRQFALFIHTGKTRKIWPINNVHEQGFNVNALKSIQLTLPTRDCECMDRHTKKMNSNIRHPSL